MAKDSGRKRGSLGRNISIIASSDNQTALYRSTAPIALTHNYSNMGREEEAIVSHLYSAESGHEQQTFSREKVSHAVLHRHDYFELLFVMEGEVPLRIEKGVYILHRGEACLINRSTRHTELNDRDYGVVFLHLSVDYVQELLPQLSSAEKDGAIIRFLMENLMPNHSYQKDYLLCSPVSTMEPADSPDTYLKGLETEFSRRTPGYDFFVRGLTLRFLSVLQDTARYKTQHVQINSSMEEEIFDRMIAFMERKHGQVTRSYLAEELQYSGHYLNQIMKKYTGMTIISYAQQLRLRAAAELLEQTDDSITEISSRLGFENRSYFYRIFRDQYGVTPAEYRAHV